jgi:poly(A) polymerase
MLQISSEAFKAGQFVILSGPEQLSRICRELIGGGFRLFLYGSTARNMLLGNIPTVHYLLTDADLVELARLDEEMEFPGRSDYDGQVRFEDHLLCFKIFTQPREGIDFSFLREQTREQQLTIDGFFYDAARDSYMDPWSAYYDLRKRMLSPLPHFSDAFRHHPHIMLESLDLFSNNEFSITEKLYNEWDKSTFCAQKEDLAENRRSLTNILTSPLPYRSLAIMERFQILTRLFPDLETMREVPQDKDHHPEGNVYEHTLECFKYVEKPSAALSIALLFHDIGKPFTMTHDRNARFPDHSRIGAKKARHILKKFGYDQELIDDIVFLIEHHLLWRELSRRDEKGKRELMRHRLFPDLMRLYKADISSCYGNFEEYQRIATQYKRIQRRNVSPCL